MNTLCLRKVFITIATLLTSIPVCNAQLNIQFNYDLARPLYDPELNLRPCFTTTIENFSTDKWGSTFFFVDANIGNGTMKDVYVEFAREF